MAGRGQSRGRPEARVRTAPPDVLRAGPHVMALSHRGSRRSGRRDWPARLLGAEGASTATPTRVLMSGGPLRPRRVVMLL